MNNQELRFAHRTCAVALSVLSAICAAPAHAQESVNKELDDCVRSEQMKLTVKGAAVGALAGLLKSAVSDNKKGSDTAKNVGIGAVAGGAIGFATAYFRAVGTCYKKNRTWIPESNIQRGKGYEQAKKDTDYKPEMGVVAKTLQVQVPAAVKAGDKLAMSSRFVLMTPEGSEAEVTIERKLFVIDDGKETQLPFPGHAREQRKVEPGESVDEAQIPIPADMHAQDGKALTLRYEFSVAVADKAPSVASGKSVIN